MQKCKVLFSVARGRFGPLEGLAFIGKYFDDDKALEAQIFQTTVNEKTPVVVLEGYWP